MNSFRFSIIRKNKLLCIIFLLLFSLMSVYMPHSLVESSVHHNYESSFINLINSYKPVANLRNLLKKLKSFVNELFRLTLIRANRVAIATICLVFLNMLLVRFSKVSILYLFPFLCSHFHGSKYKHNLNYSDLLPLMGSKFIHSIVGKTKNHRAFFCSA